MLKNKALREWIVSPILAVALVTPLWAAAQAPYERIVVFGTSLSDPGNAFALAGGTNTPPDYDNDPFLVPNTPYARGGHHFSNGATWIEQFARPMGLAGSVGPAFRGSGAASNYAVGGARARLSGDSPPLPIQVGAFLQQFGAAPSNALYIIEMGGNDLRDALQNLDPRLGDGNLVTSLGFIDSALRSIDSSIRSLYAAGAKKFLVWNAPNIGLTPAIAPLGPVAVETAHTFVKIFNHGQSEFLNQLRSDLSGIEIITLDVYAKVNDVVLSENPAEFGFTTVKTACIKPNVPPYVCQNPDEHFFWDGIHPTKAAHALIAQTASALAP